MKTKSKFYKKNEFYLECYRIKVLEGGNYEIIEFRRTKRNRK